MHLACRLCTAPLTRTFVELGMSPSGRGLLRSDQLDAPTTSYPLHVRICERCLLVQLPADGATEEILTTGSRFTSDPGGFPAPSGLGVTSLGVDVAGNAGSLLQHTVPQTIRVLGVEPHGGVADAARAWGVPPEPVLLDQRSGADIAARHGAAELVVGNNVLARVPNLRSLVRGLRALVADDGAVSLDFPYLLRLVEGRRFDTIGHECCTYFTLRTASAALEMAGLTVVDVAEPSPPGTLRVLARPGPASEPSDMVRKVLAYERDAGLHALAGHVGFADDVLDVKAGLLAFLLNAAREGRTVAGYGALRQGDTLLNHCGVRRDLLPFIVDPDPHKHGMHLAGTRIPVYPPERIAEERPTEILVLPGKPRAEAMQQLAYTRAWNARLVVPIPRLEFLQPSPRKRDSPLLERPMGDVDARQPTRAVGRD